VAIIRLGRNVLRWCDSCNLPILEEKICPVCKASTTEVLLTPPGDCRPAFDYDINKIMELADSQFGKGCGELLLPENRIIILSRSPALDRMDEIVSDGEILGAIMFDPPTGDKLIIRTPAAERMLSGMKGKVVADAGALPSISDGSNLMGPGVVTADERIGVGDEVAILTPEGTIHATGVARRSGKEMMQRGRGVAVKVRWVIPKNQRRNSGKANDWRMAADANKDYIERRVQTAKNFLADLAKRYDKPIAVSFSGGKDSLVTLNLALESGLRPDILFANTGLELDETVEEVRRVAKETGLRLIVEDAGDAFWEGVEVFGPPGKDFRWCCKTCKLGPTTKLISKNYPNGVVSLIGQRDYESEQRMRKGSVWNNPWVPGQIGASPIQKWNSLLVWLYIFSRKLKYNPWYERGLDRIGCFMCPSSDIAELRTVKEGYPGFARWEEYIDSYRKERELPDSWKELEIWRWRRLPPAMRNKLKELGISFESCAPEDASEAPLQLKTATGYRPCTEGGYSLEGVFTRKLNLERVQNLLNIIGPVEYLKDENIAKTGGIIVFGEGAVSIKEKDEETIRDISKRLEQLVIRAMFCVGCGVCVGRCRSGALTVNGLIRIDPEKCIHCGECLGPCPVLRFGNEIE
jgi:phosphoadenosine phosphosulfate reductase